MRLAILLMRLLSLRGIALVVAAVALLIMLRVVVTVALLAVAAVVVVAGHVRVERCVQDEKVGGYKQRI
jgi:hypothetical protein